MSVVTFQREGSIKQHVGELKNWDSWKPGSNHSWLLIAGAMDPPKGVVVSKRRDRGGKFLRGIKWDLANMEEAILNSAMGLGDLFNIVRDNLLLKSEAEIKLKQFLQKCNEENKKPIIYYTGHGQAGTGNWFFQDGTLSIQDIEKLVCSQYPLIIADCCFSGHWANYCRKYDQTRGFHTLSAAPEFSVSYDHPVGGGELTQWITGKGGRPSTEPLYSVGNHKDYKPDIGNIKIDIEDFVLGHVENNNYTVISQTMSNKWYHAVFAVLRNLTPRPQYKIRVEQTIAEVELDWRITSMASNDTLISVFYLDQPCDQILVPMTDQPGPDYDEYSHGTVVITCSRITAGSSDSVASSCVLGVVSHRYQYLVTRLVKIEHGDQGVVAGHV